jgi:alpha-beta hydrolase superfamily lysophospholipase
VAVDTEAERVVYYVSEDPRTDRAEREYTARDGSVLGFVAHTSATPRAAIVYLHGVSSHAGWFDAAGDGLAARGFDVFCLDRRGSGINRENRGYTSGHVDRARTLLDDVHDFVEPLHEQYEHVFIAGLSWGGKLALAYTLSHPDAVDAQVFITPGLVAEVDLGVGQKLGVGLGTLFWPTSQIRTPISPPMFTTTPFYVDRIRTDPLRLRTASARFWWENVGLDGLIDDGIEENRLQSLLFLADGDEIIDNDAVTELLLRGGTTRLRVLEYAGQTHSIQFDATHRLVDDMANWLDGRMRGD